ncbi:hypothetical protein JCM10908_000078 [Rhodotorula pacifica]|uniref:uncharacterized protein n=1 Tax=Rhodotorula pacifica TaxID=1495444 RepID=UPI00316F614C
MVDSCRVAEEDEPGSRVEERLFQTNTLQSRNVYGRTTDSFAGNRAHPFKVPAFTRAEAELIWSRTEAELRERLYSLVGVEGPISSESLGADPPRYSSSPHSDLVYALRREGCLECHSRGAGNGPGTFGTMFIQLYGQYTGGNKHLPADDVWFSEWLHRMTANVAQTALTETETNAQIWSGDMNYLVDTMNRLKVCEQSLLNLTKWVEQDTAPHRAQGRLSRSRDLENGRDSNIRFPPRR